LEALAKAGDLGANARVDQVLVIREKGAERQVFTHDLRSKEIFNSPAFYLEQNDVVYVVPKYRKKDKEDSVLQYVTLVLSFATAAASILWYIDRK
ncbi:MAG: polysaccharide export protein, partial [Alistipes sp.]|nr:polysaccharide export protein [Alistipes sp.]